MSKKYKISRLSADFFKDYCSSDFPEIENKNSRPYLVLMIKIDDNIFAIPFRTNIRHKYSYQFKNSSRPSDSITGLDYTKAIIIDDDKYIGEDTNIDNKEYIELNKKFYFILNQFKNYVNGYYDYVDGKLSDFSAKKYKYTTLKYFHKQLHIKK